MKLAPYTVALATLILFDVSAGAQDFVITDWKVTSETKTDQEGSSTKTEVETSFEPTDVDPTTGDFVVTTTCDGGQQIRLTIPFWGWEVNPRGGFSTISNDPILNGAILVVSDNGMEEEIPLSMADAQADSTVAEAQITTETFENDGRLGPACIGETQRSVQIGNSLGLVTDTGPGTSIREFKFDAAAPAPGTFTHVKSESKVTRTEESTHVEFEWQSEFQIKEGTLIDPTIDGAIFVWIGDEGRHVLSVPYIAWNKKFLDLDQNLFRFELKSPCSLDEHDIEFTFDDGVSETKLPLDCLDAQMQTSESTLHAVLNWADDLPGSEANNLDPHTGTGHQPAAIVVVGSFEAQFGKDDIGEIETEFEIMPNLQVGDVEICGNGIDDDGDGLIDGQDPDCTVDPL